MDDRAEPSSSDLVLLDALWSGVVNGWDDDDRHRKFLDHARAVHALPEAARRYRKVLDDPERGADAKRRLSAIALLATTELYATRTTPPTRKLPTWLVALGFAVCGGLLLWAAWAFAMAGR